MRIKEIICTILLIPFMVTSTASAASIFDTAKNEACRGTEVAVGSTGCGTDSSGKLDKTIANIVNVLSVIIGIAAVIVIIVNGLRFITSGGDSNTVSSAKNGILYAVVGLIIVALAQVIVRFVLSKA